MPCLDNMWKLLEVSDSMRYLLQPDLCPGCSRELAVPFDESHGERPNYIIIPYGGNRFAGLERRSRARPVGVRASSCVHEQFVRGLSEIGAAAVAVVLRRVERFSFRATESFEFSDQSPSKILSEFRIFLRIP